MSLSKRAESWSSRKAPAFFYKLFSAYRNQYDSETNPDGVISLALAENALSLPQAAKRFGEAPPCQPAELVYSSVAGSLQIREIIANFLEKYVTRTPVLGNHVACFAGAATAISSVCQTLCDPGEVIIVTGPGYGRLDFEIGATTGIIVRVAQLDQVDSPNPDPILSVQALQDEYEAAKKDGLNVRGVLIISPNNPTGEVVPASIIADIVSWSRQNHIHAIFDEVYALSVYDETHKFCSVAQVLDGQLGDDVHIIWSMSKDFCMGGIRFGVLFSQNATLLAVCGRTLAFFSATSRQTQKAVADMLSDESWVNTFVAENAARLKEGYECCTRTLDEFAIPYFPAAAGFFVWVDMRKFMSHESLEEELALWERLCDSKVLVNPGSDCFGRRYGYFRFCFSAVPIDQLETAMERLGVVFRDLSSASSQSQ